MNPDEIETQVEALFDAIAEPAADHKMGANPDDGSRRQALKDSIPTVLAFGLTDWQVGL